MGGGGSKDVSLLGLSMQTKHGPYGLATEKELREALSKSGGGAGGKADKTGWSPIMYASFNGNESAVSLLLEAGTQVSPGDSKGPCCPLHIAAAADEGGIVTILLQVRAPFSGHLLRCTHICILMFMPDNRPTRTLTAWRASTLAFPASLPSTWPA